MCSHHPFRTSHSQDVEKKDRGSSETFIVETIGSNLLLSFTPDYFSGTLLKLLPSLPLVAATSTMFKTDVWLLAALYFSGIIDAAITSNYTQAILSSGTSKRALLLSSHFD